MHKAFEDEVGRRQSNRYEGSSTLFELHGSLQEVVCLHCLRRTPRSIVQTELGRLNPKWCPLLDMSSTELKINADGDVDLSTSPFKSTEFQYGNFRYPPCPFCLAKYGNSNILQLDDDGAWIGGTAGIVKPAVIFFGENVSSDTRQEVDKIIQASDQLLIIGTTLAVLSAQRLVRRAKADGKRIAILTSGHVRNEEALLQMDDVRIWWRSSDVFQHLPELSMNRKSVA